MSVNDYDYQMPKINYGEIAKIKSPLSRYEKINVKDESVKTISLRNVEPMGISNQKD